MYNTRKSEFLKLAMLLNKFRLSNDPAEVYDLVIDNYDDLLDLIENQKSVVKLALMSEMPVRKIRESAEAILDSMFFNKKNDPYITLGLRGNEDKSTVTKRWRQLITLFHPDKYPEGKIYEEKAKRINEAYEEIRRSDEKKKKQDKHIYFKQNDKVSEIIKMRYHKTIGLRSRAGEFTLRHNQTSSRFLRKLPLILVAIMLFVSFLSVIFLIKKF